MKSVSLLTISLWWSSAAVYRSFHSPRSCWTKGTKRSVAELGTAAYSRVLKKVLETRVSLVLAITDLGLTMIQMMEYFFFSCLRGLIHLGDSRSWNGVKIGNARRHSRKPVTHPSVSTQCQPLDTCARRIVFTFSGSNLAYCDGTRDGVQLRGPSIHFQIQSPSDDLIFKCSAPPPALHSWQESIFQDFFVR